MTLSPDALSLLCCPRGCRAALVADPDAVACTQCGARYPVRGGVIDFLPNVAGSEGRAQRVMENEWVAKIYEDHWRPWFTALGGKLDYAAEEAWLLARHADVPDGPVLDLACGSGRYARLFSRLRPGQVVLGVDLSLPMLQEASRRAQAEGLGNLVLVRASAQQLPLRDSSLALINCFGALHLFPDPESALHELGRVAKASAHFTCLTARTLSAVPSRLAQRAFSRLASFKFFDERTLRTQLQSAGFGDYASTAAGALLLFNTIRR